MPPTPDRHSFGTIGSSSMLPPAVRPVVPVEAGYSVAPQHREEADWEHIYADAHHGHGHENTSFSMSRGDIRDIAYRLYGDRFAGSIAPGEMGVKPNRHIGDELDSYGNYEGYDVHSQSKIMAPIPTLPRSKELHTSEFIRLITAPLISSVYGESGPRLTWTFAARQMALGALLKISERRMTHTKLEDAAIRWHTVDAVARRTSELASNIKKSGILDNPARLAGATAIPAELIKAGIEIAPYKRRHTRDLLKAKKLVKGRRHGLDNVIIYGNSDRIVHDKPLRDQKGPRSIRRANNYGHKMAETGEHHRHTNHEELMKFGRAKAVSYHRLVARNARRRVKHEQLGMARSLRGII